ncbi:MAG: glycosyltransferase family 4 protein [Desulfobacterales bacterium]|nr:glycosyltransferase family 4 protein [Desulfobacterales bacterium]
MKILYHHRTLGDGAEGIHIREMVSAFRKLGHDVEMAGPAAKENQPRGVKPAAWGEWLKKLIPRPVYEILELGYNLAALVNLHGQIRRVKPDFIYDRYMIFNYAVVGLGKWLGIPVFLEFNAPLAHERHVESDEKLYFKSLAHHLEAKTSHDAHKTIVVSTPLKIYLQGQGVPGENIMVMPNGVNRDTFYPLPRSKSLLGRYHLTPENVVIGFTGILRPWHGIDLLVNAFARIHETHPHAVLLLVGDGAIREEIMALARQQGCEKGVIITGRVPHDQVNAHISLFDVAVSPKTTFYASPMKIPEYMAMGKPVVAPDTPNIHDLIQDNITGCLFEKESVDSLHRVLDGLISKPEKMSCMGQAGLDEVGNRLNWEHIAEQVIAAHGQWLAQKS